MQKTGNSIDQKSVRAPTEHIGGPERGGGRGGGLSPHISQGVSFALTHKGIRALHERPHPNFGRPARLPPHDPHKAVPLVNTPEISIFFYNWVPVWSWRLKPAPIDSVDSAETCTNRSGCKVGSKHFPGKN